MDYMRNARKRRNLTQKQLARMLNLSASIISLYENDRRTPCVDTAKLIAGALGFKWTRFFEDE